MLRLRYAVSMVICDNCNVCVTKNSFCSDRCRVAFHRKSTKPPKSTFESESISGVDGVSGLTKQRGEIHGEDYT